MKSKAIIFDLDGTAVDSPIQKLPSEKLVDSIDKLHTQYYLSSATGRVWTFAKSLLQSLKLVDPCIISAGTQICDPKTGQILWQKNLDDQVLKKVISLLCKYPDYKLLFNDNDEHEYFYGGINPKDFATSKSVYFLEQVFVPDALAIEIHAKASQIPDLTCVMVVAQKQGTRDLHFINSQATKEHAVAELLKIIKIKKSDTIGIGDGHNDIHLFNAVHHKVAMGNAVDDLKNIADEVIGSVSQDGLAGYFESLI
jgi:hypothetical protein